MAESGKSREQILDKFSILTSAFWRIINNKEVLQSHAKKGSPVTTKKGLYAKHPKEHAKLEAFVSYATSSCLPVTRKLLQERLLIAAIIRCITTFNARSAYIENFMKMSGIHSSVLIQFLAATKNV